MYKSEKRYRIILLISLSEFFPELYKRAAIIRNYNYNLKHDQNDNNDDQLLS